MNTRRASNSIVRAVRQRVQRKPGAMLVLSSVRRVPIPNTQFLATIFIYELAGSAGRAPTHHFVAEIAQGDLPHVYNTCALKDLSTYELARGLGETLTLLSHTATHDPRFTRNVGGIIQLNGAGGS